MHVIPRAEPAAQCSTAEADQLVKIYTTSIEKILGSGANDQGVRAALMNQYRIAYRQTEFLVALAGCIQNSVDEFLYHVAHHPNLAAGDMARVCNQFAFYASVEGPKVVDSMTWPLTLWVRTIDRDRVGQPDRRLWMNQAAVFSFLTRTENGLHIEPNLNPPPAWLHERRQVLHDQMPDAGRIVPVIGAHDWDKCLACLQDIDRSQ